MLTKRYCADGSAIYRTQTIMLYNLNLTVLYVSFISIKPGVTIKFKFKLEHSIQREGQV